LFIKKNKISTSTEKNPDKGITPLRTINQNEYRLKCKTQTLKFQEDDIGDNLGNLGFSNKVLNSTPNIKSMKERIDKLNFIKIQFFNEQHNHENDKTQHEKIPGKDMSNERLSRKIYMKTE
jgi:hypothetical protein